MHHSTIAAVLVGIAVALSLACSVGIAVMKSPLQRLHFSAPVCSFGVALIACAVWLDDPNWQARLKVALIAMIMFLMNAILSHATARAVRIREDKHFEPVASEDIPLVAAGEASEPGAQAEKMIYLQMAVLALVVASGTIVALNRQIAGQPITVSMFGLVLALMFMVFQEPDVALSQIVVGAVGLPLMILLAVAKLRRDEQAMQREKARETRAKEQE